MNPKGKRLSPVTLLLLLLSCYVDWIQTGRENVLGAALKALRVSAALSITHCLLYSFPRQFPQHIRWAFEHSEAMSCHIHRLRIIPPFLYNLHLSTLSLICCFIIQPLTNHELLPWLLVCIYEPARALEVRGVLTASW